MLLFGKIKKERKREREIEREREGERERKKRKERKREKGRKEGRKEKERSKLGIAVIIFCITGLLERKETYSWKEFKSHPVQDFTSKKWTILTFNIIAEKKIPHSFLVIFNILHCQIIFLMLCLKSVFLFYLKWKHRNRANHLCL